MANEYAKNKALMKRLKEHKIGNVDFGLRDPVAYVENIRDTYDNTDNKFINHPVKGVIKENELKQFDSLDSTSYPSDPIQQRKLKNAKDDELLYSNIIPRLKAKKTKALKKKSVADNFSVDTTGLSRDFNNYLNIRKEFEKSVMPPKIKEPKAEPKEEGGLHTVLETDLLYRRKKGLDF